MKSQNILGYYSLRSALMAEIAAELVCFSKFLSYNIHVNVYKGLQSPDMNP